MKELKEKILTEGVAIGTQIVKVDNFLNHKLDVAFSGSGRGRNFIAGLLTVRSIRY